MQDLKYVTNAHLITDDFFVKSKTVTLFKEGQGPLWLNSRHLARVHYDRTITNNCVHGKADQ